MVCRSDEEKKLAVAVACDYLAKGEPLPSVTEFGGASVGAHGIAGLERRSWQQIVVRCLFPSLADLTSSDLQQWLHTVAHACQSSAAAVVRVSLHTAWPVRCCALAMCTPGPYMESAAAAGGDHEGR